MWGPTSIIYTKNLDSHNSVGAYILRGDMGGYPHMGWILRSFQDQVARQLTRRIPQQRQDEKWEYNSAEATRVEAGFDKMEAYIHQRKNMAAQYIATRSLL